MKENKNIIAVTGNIGSGKSTVMSMIEDLGYKTLSADKFTQTAYKFAIPKLTNAFGEEVIQNGEVCRPNLSKVAFSSPENLATLNKIMHPIIFDLIFEECKKGEASFVEVPLLFESGMQDYFSSVWLVKASSENKIARASVRDSLPKEEIAKRLSFQKNHEEKNDKVHIIIENNGDICELKEKVKKAISQI